jgi:DNA-binding SARP family transcriptional activator
MYLEGLHHLAHHHYEQGDYERAIRLSQRALAEDWCAEALQRVLMACYVAQGQRHLAVRQYQTYVATLQADFGLAPSADLQAFYRQLVATTAR